jgi:hypothetical protein
MRFCNFYIRVQTLSSVLGLTELSKLVSSVWLIAEKQLSTAGKELVIEGSQFEKFYL